MSKNLKIVDVEKYLSIKNVSLDNVLCEEIEELRQNAILNQDEGESNYCWCLQQIFKIQKGYVSAIHDLKNQKYEDAWLISYGFYRTND